MSPGETNKSGAPIGIVAGGGDGATEESRHTTLSELTPETPLIHDAIAKALGDPSWRIRKAALGVLQRTPVTPELIDRLIDGMGDPDNAGLRNACAEGLSLLGDKAVGPLTQALRTPDADQRK